MDSLFFIASKTLGMVARVETWMIAGLALCLIGVLRDRRRMALGFGLATMTLIATLTIWPLGDVLLTPLEAQYPRNPPITAVDGIIVLGGAEHTGPYRNGAARSSTRAESV